jgi:NAD+ synthase (glutamine-hydrolysing)
MNQYGYIKTAVSSPKLRVADPYYNAEEIISCAKKADQKQAQVLVFPELSITGYTCGDLFHQDPLLDAALQALQQIQTASENLDTVLIVGIPLRIKNELYNCGAVLQHGRLLGIVPKIHLPNYREFYEKRWFHSGSKLLDRVTSIPLFGEDVPFGSLLFHSPDLGFTLGLEICEDLWSPTSPSIQHALNGAQIIANLSASNGLVAKTEDRHQLVSQQSDKLACAYLYASAGVHESTTDLVFDGDLMIYENGTRIKEGKRFCRTSQIIYGDIDLQRLNAERKINNTFSDAATADTHYQFVELKTFKRRSTTLDRVIEPNPFIPNNPAVVKRRCEEIFQIQAAGLAKRMEHTRLGKIVVGISGGLDSTLAILVAAEAFDLLNIPRENIIAVTMPGFGTSTDTHANAHTLMRELGVTAREISIKAATEQHLKDIGHSLDARDVTYENAQARERTQILMDLANQQGALVLGTGDLSEVALGWSTYNGDHMSMYNVNASIPKTLVKFLVNWCAEKTENPAEATVLKAIVDTPISPELLPPDENDKIAQKTESLIGPYELHDFFLFYIMKYGTHPEKLLYMADKAYAGKYTKKEILHWMKAFYRRFFMAQYKRSCMPDGPKVGTVSLSPRGDWRMPSDASGRVWLDICDSLEADLK